MFYITASVIKIVTLSKRILTICTTAFTSFNIGVLKCMIQSVSEKMTLWYSIKLSAMGLPKKITIILYSY